MAMETRIYSQHLHVSILPRCFVPGDDGEPQIQVTLVADYNESRRWFGKRWVDIIEINRNIPQ
jgi:hypothetical protein